MMQANQAQSLNIHIHMVFVAMVNGTVVKAGDSEYKCKI